MPPPLLIVRDLFFAHGTTRVLADADLDLGEGEVLMVVGPSGCGKTTLLRVIAGLERPASGSVRLGGTVLCEEGVFLPPEKRPVGMVFQGLALFPHLTVAGNTGFGLHRLPRAERARKVEEELAAVGLEGLGGRYPHQLSGGQQQRVAIARALVLRPRVLLMDEPFSGLDGATRTRVRGEVGRILGDHGTAAIIVSHDPDDARHLGDRTVMMEHGRVSPTGTPAASGTPDP